jgi:DNA-binding transcriptional ArsR family regulator/uncharacterized protein YkvS
MSFRRTALTVVNSSDLEKRSFNKAQLRRARAVAKDLKARLAAEVGDFAEVKDGLERIEAIDVEIQFHIEAQNKLLRLRDQTILEVTNASDSPADTIETIAELLLLSDNRIRQMMTEHRSAKLKKHRLSRAEVQKVLTEEFLRREYLEKERTTVDIAEEVQVTPQTVTNYLNRFGIPKRGKPNKWYDTLITEKYLREEYVDKGRTTVEIADELGVAQQTVANHLEKHGISRRDPGTRPRK